VNLPKLVYEAASKNLVPVTLELGGKSPVIVDETANIKVASDRISFATSKEYIIKWKIN
jgi:aldehyde dehydrogenase (NAD+)